MDNIKNWKTFINESQSFVIDTKGRSIRIVNLIEKLEEVLKLLKYSKESEAKSMLQNIFNVFNLVSQEVRGYIGSALDSFNYGYGGEREHYIEEAIKKLRDIDISSQTHEDDWM